MNKRNRIIIAMIVVILITTFYQVNRQKQYNVFSLSKVKQNQITSIKLYYGRPRMENTVINDKQHINKFIKVLNQCKVVPIKNQPEIDGYYQACVIYINEKQVIDIIFGNLIKINGVYYKVVKGEISKDIVDEYMK